MAMGHNAMCECVECYVERLSGNPHSSFGGSLVVEINDGAPRPNPVETDEPLDVARLDWLEEDWQRLDDVYKHMVGNGHETVRESIDWLAAQPVLSGDDTDTPVPP